MPPNESSVTIKLEEPEEFRRMIEATERNTTWRKVNFVSDWILVGMLAVTLWRLLSC